MHKNTKKNATFLLKIQFEKVIIFWHREKASRIRVVRTCHALGRSSLRNMMQ